uniref:Uncharacterized protein n=1 Tax=Plectus sambesii TaxID=2011161 RepID=A0A914WP41_9BILA
MKRTGMRKQHAARTVGGTGIISCPPDFGTERRRLRRHRLEISPPPATALLHPHEEQSPRSDNEKTTKAAEKDTIRERRLVTTAPDNTGEHARPRSSQTVSASLQWPGAPPKGHTLGAYPPALRNSSELPTRTPIFNS